MALPVTCDEAKSTLPDAWDFKDRPAIRCSTGGWTSAAMILGVEACERLTTLGIAFNLVTYLTETMHLGRVTSANIVTNVFGTSFILSLPAGFIADAYLGRHLTITIFTAIQAAGVTMLTISAVVPNLRPPKFTATSPDYVPASGAQLIVLYIALYVYALGTGGLKSSVSGFGSDQFDDTDKQEGHQMNKFFNWFFFFTSIGSLGAATILIYIEDDFGWPWGYGICSCAVVIGLAVFLSGTKRYRFKKLAGSPLTQIAAVFVAAWRNRRAELPEDSSMLYDGREFEKEKQELPHTKQFRFLDKAAIKDPSRTNMVTKWSISTLTHVEEVKLVLRMLPIWATTVMFWTIYVQMSTFSVSQAATMNRHIGKSFKIPAASLNVFSVGSNLLTAPFYDWIVVPITRKLLKNPQGLTPLQRIGTGLLLSIFAIVAAALTEIKRLHVARSHGLTSDPTVVPLSVFWLIPQFFLVGSGQSFIYIGHLDFSQRECPKGMKAMSTGLFLSTISSGFFASSILVIIVDKVTGDRKPWLSGNINKGKLYNFYWLLAVLSGLNFFLFLVCAKWYVYKEKRLAEED
ncbi:protein NRT1/ PTR FAMILY 6.3-like [Rhododendron vialii]|uniref:protein NRT1/ PTR FAMILY 6.3-like n=1 Tax=Rhododendron vialii TaxID=182163 RepID=UPI00265E490D|nr:protein NRT1/ PTR FAMILY 6.3-like [Rhododendron vialii]